MSRRGSWFEVDRAGLAEVAKRRGMAFIITEPIQNAWDEDVTRVEVTLEPVPNAPKVDLTVRDDSPDGFRDLADSYLMFRTSYKLDNPEQRGRFNVGEKLLLSVAEEARIDSTRGSVIFGPNGRTTGRKPTDSGTVLTARLKMTRAELEEAEAFARTLLPPPGVRTSINGYDLPEREPLAEGEARLDTETRSPEGGFRYTNRNTTVRVYEPLPGEDPSLYEMGIPVDELSCPWHVEVMQKVPLSLDRSSVRYGYETRVLKAVAEIMAARMTEEQAEGAWLSSALERMTDEEAVRKVIEKRFGQAVTFDPSSPESNKLALDAGYKVVHGGELSKAAWNVVKGAAALEPAGRVFPDGRVKTSDDGVPSIPRTEWDEDMEKLAAYAEAFSEHVVGRPLGVTFYDHPDLGFRAFCGQGTVGFNMAAAGLREAVQRHDHETVDELLIHECAHVAVDDHLTHAFHNECCRIGAKARSLREHLWDFS